MTTRFFVLLGLSLAACNASQPSASQPAPTAPPAPVSSAEPAKAAEPVKPAEPAEAAKQPTSEPSVQAPVEIKLHVNGNAMKFDVSAITAAPGQPVHVVLTNDKPGALSHNWVLVKPGTEASVAAAGLKEGAAKGYLPAISDVLAHTDMIPPGSSTEVTFNAPQEPGKYPYICTFPGHYMMMKGVLTVAP